MPKNILLLVGHPDEESYNFALADAYAAGVASTGAHLRRINIRELDFNPNLAFGYRKRTELEPDLVAAWDAIQWADHLVWVYPVWWGSLPAIMKGFIDRLFLPGFAFQKREGSLARWDKLLRGRTARLISTMDQPTWYYRLVYARPTYHAMKQLTMQFTGVRRVKSTAIGPIRLSSDAFRAKWLGRVEALGVRDGR
ncbi:NAD(P)H-dependent oxidoreductase [Lewinella sp. W8]|uniref:NAD(P)H-dependent oxidoreductase n=1 Tax=Lewinella sp. W8 TaxID=2528208 RepID=UPI001068BE83|nr:NAD(P)H-dependent oxidoreductase [Lewinella sp. W8]MTB49794.1 flavodoxin family protein [Lewinella sp. W8]